MRGPKPKKYPYKDTTITAAEISELSGYSKAYISKMLKDGKTPEEIITSPRTREGAVIYQWTKDFSGTIWAASKEFGISPKTIQSRLWNGDTPERAIRPVTKSTKRIAQSARGTRYQTYTVTSPTGKTYKGTFKAICAAVGISLNTANARLSRGATMEEALFTPVQSTGIRYQTQVIFGEELTVLAAAKKYKIPYRRLLRYIDKGFTAEQAITHYTKFENSPPKEEVQELQALEDLATEMASKYGTTPKNLFAALETKPIEDVVAFYTKRNALRAVSKA